MTSGIADLAEGEKDRRSDTDESLRPEQRVFSKLALLQQQVCRWRPPGSAPPQKQTTCPSHFFPRVVRKRRRGVKIPDPSCSLPPSEVQWRAMTRRGGYRWACGTLSRLPTRLSSRLSQRPSIRQRASWAARSSDNRLMNGSINIGGRAWEVSPRCSMVDVRGRYPFTSNSFGGAAL